MELSVFNLNIWGLKYFSKDRVARVEALADCLTNNGYDVVCLQELWNEEDYKYLKLSCEHVFKYVHYFHSGMLGSGMCIMSRYPIIDIHYHSFLLNGYLHMVLHGDWFGGKGIGLCRIDVKGFIVDIYTTHLHACYDMTNDKYIRHRMIQAFETANFIRITSTGSDLAILAGDLNSDPDDICYKLIRLGANLKDCYSMCSTNSVEYTFNHPKNSYKTLKESKARIDFVLFKSSEKNLITVKEHRYSLPSRVPGQSYSYSDHEPIEAVFVISANQENFDKNINTNEDLKIRTELKQVLNYCLDVCNENSVINPFISLWHCVFLLIFVIFILYQPFIPSNLYISCILIAISILFFKVMWVYSLVIKSIELNCVRGFCHQIETLFFD